MSKARGYIQADLFGNIPDVIIDVHEVSKNKVSSVTLFMDLLKRNKVNYKIQKLEIADVILPNEYAVERKSIRDFLSSLMGSKTGRARLFEQMRNMAEAYENPILLIEGGLSIRLDVNDKAIFIPIRKKKIRRRIYAVIEERIGVHPNAFLATIRKIESMGIRVIQTYNSLHGSQKLWALYKESKEIESGIDENIRKKYPIVRVKPRFRNMIEQQIFFLCGLPGISYARAEKILRTYKTPYNAILRVNRWNVDIEGIGEKILEKAQKILFTEFRDKKTGKENADDRSLLDI